MQRERTIGSSSSSSATGHEPTVKPAPVSGIPPCDGLRRKQLFAHDFSAPSFTYVPLCFPILPTRDVLDEPKLAFRYF